MNAAAEALMVAPDVASTTAVLLGFLRAMLRPGTLVAPAETTCATDDAKKLAGYIVMMVPPERMAEVTAKNVIPSEASVFPAMHSEGEMVKITVEVEPKPDRRQNVFVILVL